MSSKSLSFWIRCSIVALAVCTVAFCGIWYPASFGLINIEFIPVGSAVPAQSQIWSMLLFFWICALPCLFILFLSWQVSTAIKNDEFFTAKTAKLIKFCAVIFFVDLGVFFVGNLGFLIAGTNDFAVLHFALVIGGIVLGVILSAVSHYVSKAAVLKEESEGTI